MQLNANGMIIVTVHHLSTRVSKAEGKAGLLVKHSVSRSFRTSLNQCSYQDFLVWGPKGP